MPMAFQGAQSAPQCYLLCAFHPSQWPALLPRLQLLQDRSSAALHTQDTTQHDAVVGCNSCSDTIKSDDSICTTCCHCPETFPYSVGRQTHSQNCLGILSAACMLGKANPLPGCCVMPLKVFRIKPSSYLS